MKAMWLLCIHSQEKLPYSLAGVDSNDVLFPTPAEKSTYPNQTNCLVIVVCVKRNSTRSDAAVTSRPADGLGCRLNSEPCVDLLNKVLQEMLADLMALKEAGVDAPAAIDLMAKLALQLYAPNCLKPYNLLPFPCRRTQLANDHLFCAAQTLHACDACPVHEANRNPGIQLTILTHNSARWTRTISTAYLTRVGDIVVVADPHALLFRVVNRLSICSRWHTRQERFRNRRHLLQSLRCGQKLSSWSRVCRRV